MSVFDDAARNATARLDAEEVLMSDEFEQLTRGTYFKSFLMTRLQYDGDEAEKIIAFAHSLRGYV